MKRVFIGLGCALLAAGIGYGAYWLTQPCRALDRLFGLSGCVQSYAIADFVALDGVSISPPQANGDVSIFGEAREGDRWEAAVVRFNLDTGAEGERHKVATERDMGTLVFSADGERAVLTCFNRSCLNDGGRSAILAAETGAIIEMRDGIDDDIVYFPGDPRPRVADAWVQLFAAGEERVIDIARNGAINLLDSNGAEIARLHDGQRTNWLASGISVSPSGTRIAMFDSARYSIPARLFVWDAQTGEPILARELGLSYDRRHTPVWTADETLLTIIRRDGRTSLLELHRTQ